MRDQIPPHDAAIERRVLAAMLADETAATIGKEALTSDDFYMPALRRVFDAIVATMAKGGALDPALLLHDGIGADVLGDICESSGQPAAIESYIAKLRDLSASRRAAVGVAEALGQVASPGQIALKLRTVADDIEAKAPAVVPDSVATMYSEMDEEVAGRRFAVSLPWEGISNEVIPLTPNSITILCGGPGATKSLMAIQAIRWILDHGQAPKILELEKGASYHLRRCAAQITGNSDITKASWCRAHPAEVEELKARLKPQLDKLRQCIEAPATSNGCTASELVAWIQSQARDHRVIAIDPITMMAKNAKTSWADDEFFMKASRRILEKHGNSLLLVTHPRKAPAGANRMHSSMDDLAGGLAYSRFADTVLFLVAHDLKSETLEQAHGTCEREYNRTLMVFKARDGSATGRRFGLYFDSSSLTLNEVGKIRMDA